MNSNSQQHVRCFKYPFGEQIQNELRSVHPTGILSETETLQHFRKQALVALKAYRAFRLDRSYPFIYGMECWERMLDNKWFDVCRAFKWYMEVRNRIERSQHKGA